MILFFFWNKVCFWFNRLWLSVSHQCMSLDPTFLVLESRTLHTSGSGWRALQAQTTFILLVLAKWYAFSGLLCPERERLNKSKWMHQRSLSQRDIGFFDLSSSHWIALLWTFATVLGVLFPCALHSCFCMYCQFYLIAMYC